MTLWTPSGERPVPREPAAAPPGEPSVDDMPVDEEALQELAQRMADMQEQLLRTPAVAVIVNHCIALYELAALHLDQESPDLDAARLAIDALAGIVDRLGERLGEHERPLRDALAALQLGYVETTRRS
ncbi:MAG: DUF1844 domain-containing protein [Acidimicrobiales bacterium]